MTLRLIIYLIGAGVSLGQTFSILQKSSGKITIVDLVFMILMAMFSRIGVLALWIGRNAKRNRHPNEK